MKNMFLISQEECNELQRLAVEYSKLLKEFVCSNSNKEMKKLKERIQEVCKRRKAILGE